MAYLNTTVKIFAFILLALVFMLNMSYPAIIAWWLTLVPLIIVYQAYIILKADVEPDKNFEEDWYDHN